MNLELTHDEAFSILAAKYAMREIEIVKLNQLIAQKDAKIAELTPKEDPPK